MSIDDLTENVEYDVDQKAIIEELRSYNNDLILLRTGVSHIDVDLKMKVDKARKLLNEVADEIEKN